MSEAKAESLTAGDIIGLLLAALTVGGLVLFPVVGSEFRSMYGGFGAELPMLTRLVVQPWCAPALALLPACGLAVALVPRLSLRDRRLSIVLAFIVGAATLGACVGAVYLPVFQLGGAIS